MADDKKMTFLLSAQLGGEFQTAFGNASKTIQQAQAQIKALNAEQSNITAYQKQQEAVAKTASKLEALKADYNDIQKEMQETEGFSSSLSIKEREKQRQIEQTAQKLEQQTQKLGEMGTALTEAGHDTDNLDKESAELRDQMDKLGDKMKDASEKGVSGFEAIGSALVAAGVLEGVKKLGEVYADCVRTSSEFSAAMSQVSATMGVTNQETQDLAAFAKEMGASTAFSASEAAQGLNILAMAGLNADQQIATLPAVLDLAAAGAMDLQSASTFVAGSVKGFGDRMDNASYYADLMAKGATMANTSVTMLGEAMVTGAATASSYGQSAESMTLSLLRLADQNVTGSEAATKLNRAMADLYTPTDKAKEALDELGISAYDLSTGAARDFGDVVEELSAALSGMSAEEQNTYKNTIFTTNGLNAFNKMTAASTETVEGFREGLANASGSAAQQAKTQLDNLSGAMTILNSATEGLKITIGEQFEPMFTKIINIASNVIQHVNEFAQRNPVLVKTVIALTAELGGLLAVYTSYVAIKKIWTKVTEMETVAKIAATVAQQGFNTALLTCPITWIVAGVTALTVAVVALSNSMSEEEKAVLELSASSKAEYEALQEKTAEYENAVEVYGEHSEQTIQLKYDVDRLTESYENNRMTVDELIQYYDDEQQKVADTVGAYYDRMDAIQDNSTKVNVLASRLQELATQTSLTAGEESEMKAIIDELNSTVPNLSLDFEELAGSQGDFMGYIDQWAEAQAGAEKYGAAMQSLPGLLNSQKAAEQNLKSSEADLKAAQDRLTAANEAYSNSVYGNGNGLNKVIGAFSLVRAEQREAEAEVRRLTEEVTQNQEAYDQATNAVGDARDVLQEYADATYGATEDDRQMNSAVSETVTQMEELCQAYNDAYTAAYDSISGQYELWDHVEETVATDIGSIIENLQSQNEHWESYNANLEKLQAQTGNVEGLSDVIASFADGSEESVAAIAGMAEATPAELQKMVAEWKKVQDSQKTTSDSLATLVTDFNNKMTKLVGDFEGHVSSLNMSGEAYTSGYNTIQGFINGAAALEEAVKAKYAAIGQAAIDAMNDKLKEASPSKVFDQIGRFAIQGFVQGSEAMQPQVAEVMTATGQVATESILPALSIPSGDRGGSSVSVTFNIEGNATPQTVEALDAYGDEFARRVLRVMEEAQEDSARRVYR